jgi:hypothetical protein
MSDEQKPGTPARGQQAYKASLDRVAQRNEQAKKAAEASRRAHEDRVAATRRAASLKDLGSERRGGNNPGSSGQR